jgi:hypothetical protein
MVVGRGERMERESVLIKTGYLRCPACFLIRDLAAKDLTCALTRSPHVFVDVSHLAYQSGPALA